MDTNFLGIPLVAWGAGCLAVAAIFTFVWPSDKVAGDTSAARYFILRWGHALVWALLALSMFVRAAGAGNLLANLIAVAALPTYLIYLAALLRR